MAQLMMEAQTSFLSLQQKRKLRPREGKIASRYNVETAGANSVVKLRTKSVLFIFYLCIFLLSCLNFRSSYDFVSQSQTDPGNYIHCVVEFRFFYLNFFSSRDISGQISEKAYCQPLAAPEGQGKSHTKVSEPLVK